MKNDQTSIKKTMKTPKILLIILVVFVSSCDNTQENAQPTTPETYTAKFTCLRGGDSIVNRPAISACLLIGNAQLKITKNGIGKIYGHNDLKDFNNGPNEIELPNSFTIQALMGHLYVLRLEITNQNGELVFQDEAGKYGSIVVSN